MARVISKTPFIHGKHTYDGSCHCGAVRWKASLNLDEGTTWCNCTYCTKTAWWGCITRPEGFTLLSGEEVLVPVNPGQQGGTRKRCSQCGLESFGTGDLPQLGGAFVSINVRCLDGVDLSGVQVVLLDGLHDTWAFLGSRPWVDPFTPTTG
jgi:hypothetical protein